MIRSSLKRVIKKLLSSSSHIPAEKSTQTPKSTPVSSPSDDSGRSMANIECGAQELHERIDAGESVVLVDVRESFELEESGKLPESLHIPLRELSTRWEELKNANEIICYCAAGSRSYNAAMLLREKGLFNATSLEGGIAAWKAIGAPVESTKN